MEVTAVLSRNSGPAPGNGGDGSSTPQTMNLAEALYAALPDMPARKTRVSYPKVDPGLIWQENTDDGKPVIVAMIRGRDSFFPFPPEQWNIIELFDGTRSWEDVAALHAELYGTRFDPTTCASLPVAWTRSTSGTTPQKNIALQQKLEEGRHQHAHKKSKWGDVAHMQFSAWIRIDISIGFIPG